MIVPLWSLVPPSLSLFIELLSSNSDLDYRCWQLRKWISYLIPRSVIQEIDSVIEDRFSSAASSVRALSVNGADCVILRNSPFNQREIIITQQVTRRFFSVRNWAAAQERPLWLPSSGCDCWASGFWPKASWEDGCKNQLWAMWGVEGGWAKKKKKLTPEDGKCERWSALGAFCHQLSRLWI